jgi:transposase
MNFFLSKLMVYHEIHRLSRENFSIRQISRTLGIHRNTVSNYLLMTEEQYEQSIIAQCDRKKDLEVYEEFVRSKLEKFPDTTTAQMYDWLKEKHADFPKTTRKTVYNFVMWVRQKYHIPKVVGQRDYQAVEESPYGKQAQVDFGVYNLRDIEHKRKKVWFIVIILSRSRYKYVWFRDEPFTAITAIEGHEKAFEYFRGIPEEMVYDQDRVFIVDENVGDLILTEVFKAYTKERTFKLHFCRKSDPESKGKIENFVKYVKQNFLYNRTYYNLETLNDDALGWLGRTANAMPHGRTQKSPYSEWIIEQEYLKPFFALAVPAQEGKLYSVHKDHTISWKGNFYALPIGTYKGRGTQVKIIRENDQLIITSCSGSEIYRHTIAQGKGQLVSNTELRRDKSTSIDAMIEVVSSLFEDPQMSKNYLETIRKSKPRYVRDQLQIIQKSIENVDKQLVHEVLKKCIANTIYSANDFKSILKVEQLQNKQSNLSNIPSINPLSKGDVTPITTPPVRSNIIDYEQLMSNKN